MNRLQSGDELHVDEALVSSSGWVRLVLQGDGNLVLYREQIARRLWESNTTGQPVTRVVMEADGNLIAYSSQGATIWVSGTDGNSGASALLRDDGNFVILDGAGSLLWTSDTVQDFHTPTIEIVDANGYSYVETSESWKVLCSQLPCFSALHWPGYATAVIDDEVDGERVVIQLWKGLIPQLPGVSFFPGGIGAEVGVYRRIPGALRLRSLPVLPGPAERFVLGTLGVFTDSEFWWPFPELQAELKFTLINPVSGEPVFSAGPETSYWLAKWMGQGSYLRYCVHHRARVPLRPDSYVLEYSINGRPGRWPSA
jgi:hypothetical protein